MIPANHQHGIATLSSTLTSGSSDAQITAYKSVEGQQPDAQPTTIENSNSLTGNSGDQVLVRKDGETWTLVAVIEQGGSGETFGRGSHLR